jgi:hypothetical protein
VKNLAKMMDLFGDRHGCIVCSVFYDHQIYQIVFNTVKPE